MTAHSREDEKPSCIPPTWTSVPTCTLAPPSATGCSRQHRSFPAVQSSKPACITSSPRLRLPPSTVLCPFRRHSTVSSCVASQRIPKQGRPPHSNSRAYSKPSTRRCGSGSKGKPGGVTALRACSPLLRKPAAPLAPRALYHRRGSRATYSAVEGSLGRAAREMNAQRHASVRGDRGRLISARALAAPPNPHRRDRRARRTRA